MSFDNHYPNRKDNRRNYDYKYAKSVDRTCRNHGKCTWCQNTRLINYRRMIEKAKDMLQDLE